MLFIIINNPSYRIYTDNNLMNPDIILSIHEAIMDIDVNIPTILSIITTEINNNVLSEKEFSQLTEYTNLHPCPICLEDNLENIILDCKHVFCKKCIKKWVTSNSKTCPLCRICIN
jgi:hypothetical protein